MNQAGYQLNILHHLHFAKLHPVRYGLKIKADLILDNVAKFQLENFNKGTWKTLMGVNVKVNKNL